MRQIALLSTALLMTVGIFFYAKVSSERAKSPQLSDITISLNLKNFQKTLAKFSTNI
jgi:hypothetical protein